MNEEEIKNEKCECCKLFGEIMIIILTIFLMVGLFLVYIILPYDSLYRHMINPLGIFATAFVLFMTISVLFMFYILKNKNRISGTWESLMYNGGMYASKFLLFSTTIVCFCTIGLLSSNLNSLVDNLNWKSNQNPKLYYLIITQMLFQPLFLLIGFFPNNEDNFLCWKSSINCKSIKFLGRDIFISEIIHSIAAMIYGIVMLYTNGEIEYLLQNQMSTEPKSLWYYWIFYGAQSFCAIIFIFLQVIDVLCYYGKKEGYQPINEDINNFEKNISSTSKIFNFISISMEMFFFFFSIFTVLLQSIRINSQLKPK